MDRTGSQKPNAQIIEEASTWFVELSEGEVSMSAREEFTGWLRASPEHARAFLQISVTWEDAPLLGKRDSLDLEALLDRVRSESNVVSLSTAVVPQAVKESQREARQVRRLPIRWAALAASVLAAAVGAALWLQWNRGVYSTGIGETRWVSLADGTTIELNAESRIRIRQYRTERDVDLLQGQALFHVTRNPSRPFIVHSGSAQITDVGTEFDVYRRQAETVVTVIEGRVAVHTAPSSSPMSSSSLPAGPPLSGVALPAHMDALALGTIVTAGEQVSLTPQAPVRPTHADVAAATAWTRQRLVFASTPLSEVVTQYNLYHAKPLVIQDPSLATYHVSGEFSATDSAALVAFLRAQSNLFVRDTGGEIDISSR